MKLKNSTDWPDWFLRRVVSWCCKQLDCPVREIKNVTFRNRSFGMSGRCYIECGNIVVSVVSGAEPTCVRVLESQRAGYRVDPAIIDPVAVQAKNGYRLKVVERLESDDALAELVEQFERHRLTLLVTVTAHEIAHRYLYLQGSKTRKSRRHNRVTSGGSERQTNRLEQMVVAAFEKQRDKLVAQWSEPPARRNAKPALTKQQRNERKARELLAKWERKLKLAKTKVKQYRTKCRYNVQANSPQMPRQNTSGQLFSKTYKFYSIKHIVYRIVCCE